MLRYLASVGMALQIAACHSSANNAFEGEAADDDSFRQWKLPGKLREISGLALTSDERLLAITDEEAIVYEIDYDTGGLVKAFALGEPTVRGDFEGIAVVGDTVWLMTSDGRLFATAEGRDGERVSFERYETGLGDYCEFEGLAADEASLFLACKKSKAKNNMLKIFQVSVADKRPVQSGATEISASALADKIDKKRLHPSGIAIEPGSGNRVVLAANHKALITLSPSGELIDAIILPGKRRHRQAEGIEITSDGRLLIADEGGDGRGRLAVYRWTSNGLEPEQQE